MPLYHVSYDLRGLNRDYSSIEEAIKKCRGWFHALGSTWVVWTPESVDALTSRLVAVLRQEDRMLVSAITTRPNGLLLQSEWEWINARIAVEPSLS